MSTDFKATLWKTADKLRAQMDAAEYKHLVLGLIFLKYISDSFVKQQEKIKLMVSDPKSEYFICENPSEYESELEERDYYTQDNVFWVPQDARWESLRSKAKQTDIGSIIDSAMTAIENENTNLRGKLDKRFGRAQLSQGVLGELIDLISTIGFNDKHNASDVLGEVYEYFLGQFASAEGKKGGQFYTPAHIVKTLVAVLSPHHGRVYDPCCGSGGMFVQSELFVKSHGGRIDDISIYGQESNPTTWRLAAMNLAIRGFSADLGKEPFDTFANDQHKDLKFDFIMVNPPFNDSDWKGEKYSNDVRWVYGVPPASNANFAWMQHVLHKLKDDGRAGVVLANASLTSTSSGEDAIRKKIIEANHVEAVVELPNKLFTNFKGPVCIWFLTKNKKRKDVLIVNAEKLGSLLDSNSRILNDEDIQKISETIHSWRDNINYQDVPNYCKAVSLDEIRENNFSLSTNRYVFENTDKQEFDTSKRLSLLVNNFYYQKKQSEISNNKLEKEFSQLGFDSKSVHRVEYKKGMRLENTLEEIGKELFKSWFLEFNPAFFPEKNSLKEPINHYFPKDRVVTELGPIPEGWTVSKLRDIFDILIGRTPPRNELHWFSEESGVPWVSIADLKSASIFVKNTAEYLTDEAVSKFNVPLVKPGTTILSFKLTVGRVAIANMPLVTNEAIAQFMPKENNSLSSFIYFLFKNFDFASMGSTSSIGKAVNSTMLKDLKIILPPQELINVFDDTVQTILNKSRLE